MFGVSKRQWDLLSKSQMFEFVFKVRDHLVINFSPYVENLSCQDIETEILRLVEFCEERGISRGFDMQKIIELHFKGELGFILDQKEIVELMAQKDVSGAEKVIQIEELYVLGRAL